MAATEGENRVGVAIADHVAEVTLNRPEKHNALDHAMFVAISAAIDEVAADPSVRAVVLHGAGKSFCSGLDLMSFVAEGRPVEDMFARREGEAANLAQRVAYGWQQLPAPVIAAVHGNCIGGGAQIALGADVRIIAPGSKVSIREGFWGLIPDMGLTRSLPRLVRFDVAKELVLTARIIDAEEAVRIGLATRLDDDPLSAARALAAEIAAHTPHPTPPPNHHHHPPTNHPADESLALEEELQRELLGSPNQVRAVGAGMSGDPADYDDPS
jgi:enoyl-CoA hydratase/carnithine racemase